MAFSELTSRGLSGIQLSSSLCIQGLPQMAYCLHLLTILPKGPRMIQSWTFWSTTIVFYQLLAFIPNDSPALLGDTVRLFFFLQSRSFLHIIVPFFPSFRFLSSSGVHFSVSWSHEPLGSVLKVMVVMDCWGEKYPQ